MMSPLAQILILMGTKPEKVRVVPTTLTWPYKKASS